MAKRTLQTNPFVTLLAELSLTQYQEVSIQYLTHVAITINSCKPAAKLKTYGEVFDALQYLADNNAVELLEITPGSDTFKIKKVHYG